MPMSQGADGIRSLLNAMNRQYRYEPPAQPAPPPPVWDVYEAPEAQPSVPPMRSPYYAPRPQPDAPFMGGLSLDDAGKDISEFGLRSYTAPFDGRAAYERIPKKAQSGYVGQYRGRG